VSYNQSKLNSFLDDDSISYAFNIDRKNSSFYFLFVQENKPVASINFRRTEDDEDLPYYYVDGSYARPGLGKILYYTAMMHMTKEHLPISCSLDEDIRGHANDIWESIKNDKTVIKTKLKGIFSEFEEDGFCEYCYTKKPDDVFDKILTSKNKYTDKDSIKHLIKLSNDIFYAVYEQGETPEDIKSIIDSMTVSNDEIEPSKKENKRNNIRLTP
tara:strand:- start:14 stop:655 length:642 start_codon:yes stop_codon:yes gene_type:complete